LPAVEEGIRWLSSSPQRRQVDLINRLLAKSASSRANGTTRDTVLVPFERDGGCYTLSTPRRPAARPVEGTVEKFSVIKTLQAIASANVVIALIDAQDTVADQDASLLGIAAERAGARHRGQQVTAARGATRPYPRPLEVRLPVDFTPRTLFLRATAAASANSCSRCTPPTWPRCAKSRPELTRTLEAAIAITSRRWCAAGASSSATRTRAGATRRSS
jgi:GTP-binding protein